MKAEWWHKVTVISYYDLLILKLNKHIGRFKLNYIGFCKLFGRLKIKSKATILLIVLILLLILTRIKPINYISIVKFFRKIAKP